MTDRRFRAIALIVALAAALALASVAPARADVCPGFGQGRGLIAFAKEQITVDNTVKTLTAATYQSASVAINQAAAALVSVKTAAIRVLDTGDDPSSTVGISFAAGDKFWLCGTSIQNFKATRETGVSGVIDAVYYRRN